MASKRRLALGILQNAWSYVYAGGTWPRDSWLRALQASRSGQRLSVLEAACPGVEFYYDNTTAIVGETPDSVVPPDLAHLAEVLKQPHDLVVAFGHQAAHAVGLLVPVTTPLLILPHPAYRVVTNALFTKAGKLLMEGFAGVVELRQERFKTERIDHAKTYQEASGRQAGSKGRRCVSQLRRRA